MSVVHIPAPPADGEQLCAACGELLVAWDGDIRAIPAGVPRTIWWPPTHPVTVRDDGRIVDGAVLGAEACRPAARTDRADALYPRTPS